MAETRVRVWAVAAMSGQVLGELTLAGSSSWSTALGGGPCRATVALGHLTTLDGDGYDWPAIEQTLSWVRPGACTLVATAGTQTLGEWLLLSRSPVAADGTLQIAGLGWESYPDMRSLHRGYVFENTEQMTIARTLVAEAYNEPWQTGLQLTVPTPPASGVRRDLTAQERSGYYGTLIDRIADTDQGFEWRVDSQMQWDGGVPTHVTRTVQWGHPVIGRTSQIRIDHRGPGQRAGNCTRYAQGEDYSRVVHLAAAVGSGEGRRRIVTLAEADRGSYLLRSQYYTLPETRSLDEAEAFAASRLSPTPSGMLEPPVADLLVDKLPTWPRVGDRLGVQVERTLTMPTGRDGLLRVGEVAWQVTAGHAPLVTVSGIEEAP